MAYRAWVTCAALLGLSLGSACEPAAQAGALGDGAYRGGDAGMREPGRLPRPELDFILDPPVLDQDLLFGAAVGVAGSRMVAVSAFEDILTADSSLVPNTGQLYGYRRALAGWKLEGPVERPAARPNEAAFLLSLPVGSVSLPAYSLTMTEGELFVGQVNVHVEVGPDGTRVPNAGAVFVYRRENGAYVLKQTLMSPNPHAGDHFGYRTASVGPWLAVSAISEDGGQTPDDGLFPQAGAVHLFVRRQEGWVHHDRLTSRVVQAGARFGSSLAIRDDMLLVGAMLDNYLGSGEPDDPSAPHAGSVHMYRREEQRFRPVQRLFLGRPEPEDWFGVAMALDGDYLAVAATALGGLFGAPGAGVAGGRVLMFRWNGERWMADQQLLQYDPDPLFGLALALRGDNLFVGSPREVTNDIRSGAVLVFRRQEMGWDIAQELRPADASVDDLFGASLAVSDSHLVVGAPNKTLVLPERGAPVGSAGRVYVYRY